MTDEEIAAEAARILREDHVVKSIAEVRDAQARLEERYNRDSEETVKWREESKEWRETQKGPVTPENDPEKDPEVPEAPPVVPTGAPVEQGGKVKAKKRGVWFAREDDGESEGS